MKEEGGFERTVRRRLQCRLTPTGDGRRRRWHFFGDRCEASRNAERASEGGRGGMFTPVLKPVATTATSACFTRENLKIGFLILTTGQDLR